MKLLLLLSCLLCATFTFAGQVKLDKAKTQAEVQKANDMIYAGTGMLFTIVGAPAGVALIIADNDDGSRSCWTKVLDKSDITDEATYNKYSEIGIPVEELLKHTDAAIYAPLPSCPRFMVRNRRGEAFFLRPTAHDENGWMYHADPVPKMITW